MSGPVPMNRWPALALALCLVTSSPPGQAATAPVDPTAEPSAATPWATSAGGLYFWAHDDPALNTVAADFDRHGNVIGYYTDGNLDGPLVGFVRDREGRYTEFRNLLPRNIRSVEPVALNNRGVMVGRFDARAGRFDLATRQFKRLDYPGSVATVVSDINDDGVIVGMVLLADSLGTRQSGFIWREGRFDLVETPGARHTRLLSVNDRGEISGVAGATEYGSSGGFILHGDGSRTVLKLRRNGEPVAPTSLDNNGDFIALCHGQEFEGALCLYQAASQRLRASFVPAGCYWGQAYPRSIKQGNIAGASYSLFGQTQGFVAPKPVYPATPRD